MVLINGILGQFIDLSGKNTAKIDESASLDVQVAGPGLNVIRVGKTY